MSPYFLYSSSDQVSAPHDIQYDGENKTIILPFHQFNFSFLTNHRFLSFRISTIHSPSRLQISSRTSSASMTNG